MAQKLVAFDMDGTLTNGRIVFALSDKIGLTDKVMAIQSSSMPGFEQSKEIALLFANLNRKDIESAIEAIQLTKNSERTIAILREKGHRIGIISDSYTIATRVIADRLGGMDFVAANELEEEDDGRLTGNLRMLLGWDKIGCFCKISVCKRYHLEKYAREFDIPITDTIAVGDSKADVCMVRTAGVGVAFMPKDEKIANATKNVVEEADLIKVLEFAQ